MLGKLLAPLTTAAPIGVALRDLILSLGSMLAVLGILGILSQEQIDGIKEVLPALAEQAPVLVTAVGTIMAAFISVYRIVTKSSSDKAAEVAKEVDAKVPKADPVVIKMAAHQPDIVVPPRK